MPLADGDYFVYDSAGSLVLDVAHGNRSNGANVGVLAKDSTDNQVFQVTTRTDGTRQITSRFTGKSIDAASASSGANVKMWTDNSARRQAWDVADSGSTVTIGGTAYPLYNVTLHGTALRLARSGSNAVLGSSGSWAFVPVPKMQDGGVYELVLRLDNRYALDVHSGSKSNGANIILTGRHNANDHKWVLTQSATDKWLLRNVASSKYAQVNNGTAADLTNVNQWDFNSSAPNRWLWKPVSFGDVTLGGVSCRMVKLYSWVDGGAATYVMDANQNSKLDLGNICIVHTDPDDQGQQSQQWILYPTRATDSGLPIPSALGWVKAVGGTPPDTFQQSQERLYPTWEGTDAWATSGPNHYEWRYRSRLMDPTLSTWGDWGNYTAWSTALVTQDGRRSWVTQGLPGTYDPDEAKAMQYQIEVRAAGVGNERGFVGNSATVTLTTQAEPTVAMTDATLGPSGPELAFTSDYASGTNRIVLTGIERDGTNLLTSPVTFDGLGASGTLKVPGSKLSGWLSDGDAVTVTWRDGTDVHADFGNEHEATLSVAYGPGHTTLDPIVTPGEGRTLNVDPNTDMPVRDAWLLMPDGSTIQCDENGDGTFSVAYPFGTQFDVVVTASTLDGSQWGDWSGSFSAGTGILLDQMPCHAWSWDGGSFLLECDQDPLVTDRTMSATYEALTLDSRQYQTVFFAPTIQGEFAAVGLLFRGVTESTKDDMLALMMARHVTYRAPSGEVAEVAITDVSYQTHREYTQVTVNMIEETR